jgi:gluconate kinase
MHEKIHLCNISMDKSKGQRIFDKLGCTREVVVKTGLREQNVERWDWIEQVQTNVQRQAEHHTEIPCSLKKRTNFDRPRNYQVCKNYTKLRC